MFPFFLRRISVHGNDSNAIHRYQAVPGTIPPRACSRDESCSKAPPVRA